MLAGLLHLQKVLLSVVHSAWKEHAMLKHTSSIAPDAMQSSTLPAAMPGSVELSMAREAQLEASLDHLCDSRVGAAPNVNRQEVRAHMRVELDALIAAHQELGSGWEEATSAALRNLRASYALSDNAQTQTAHLAHSRKYSARPATLLALGLFSTFYVADATKFAWNAWSHMFGDGAIIGANADASTSQHNLSEIAFYRFELLVVPLLVGLATGLLVRHRAGRGIWNALALLAIPAILVPGFFLGLGYIGLPDNLPFLNWIPSGWIPSPFPAVAGVTFWVLLGSAGAYIGQSLRGKMRLLALKRSPHKRTRF
jgi:hypothetical protein